jgi:outer membrane protein OmpA-like peptidoglycan-associated protein
VKEYLTAKGVEADKIKILKGFGEQIPVINKLDEVSRQANRRAVIITEYSLQVTDSSAEATPQAEIQVPKKDTVTKEPKKDLTEKIKDSTTKEGQNIILKNINFYGGRHIFLPQAYPPLMELYNAMKDIPTLEIEIHGHICCMDGPKDGLDLDTGEPFLSFNRARAVYEWLIKRGIDAKRMKYKGFGHQFPLISVEVTEEERTTNRRVEIKIVKK